MDDEAEQARQTWSADPWSTGTPVCRYCGRVLSVHDGQRFCPTALASQSTPPPETETAEQWVIHNVVKRLASQTLPENEDEPEAVLRLSGFIKMARAALAAQQEKK